MLAVVHGEGSTLDSPANDSPRRLNGEERFYSLNIATGTCPHKYAKISPEDAERVLLHKWHAHRMARYTVYYVRTTTWDGQHQRAIKLHRYLLGAPDGVHVDHINGDTLDNRRSNLRLCTPQQNQGNSRKWIKGSSRFKGVCWSEVCGKWRAYIAINRAQKHIGLFDDEIQAARAYDEAAGKAFGEFAYFNLR